MMTDIILKTGWKHWDKHLSRFIDKKINCLDIGAFNGDSSCWMLNNLCTHPYSKVFSVDIWSYVDEYGLDDTRNIEEEFDKAIQKTGKHEQNVKMKMKSSDAILKFKQFDYIVFDLIFISGSFEAKDIIRDAIIGWDILNENGIMIFDNYKWDELNTEYYKPSIAIDSFVLMYTPQLTKLHAKNQVIVQKINQRDVNYSKDEVYYKLLDDINYFKFFEFKYEYDHVIKRDIEFNLQSTTTREQLIDKVQQINPNIKNKDLLNMISNENFDKNNNTIIGFILNNKKLYSYFTELNLQIDKLYRLHFYDMNYLKFENNSNIFVYCKAKYKNICLKTIKETNHNIKYKITYANDPINDYIVYDKIIQNPIKYDFIYLKLFNNNYYQLIIYSMLALNIQNKNGSLFIHTSIETDPIIMSECIFLLKKYYKSVIIQNMIALNYDSFIIIYCKNFNTINDDILMNMNKQISNIFNTVNNNLYVKSFIKINSNNVYINDITHIYSSMHDKQIAIFNIYNNIYIYKRKELLFLLYAKFISYLLIYV